MERINDDTWELEGWKIRLVKVETYEYEVYNDKDVSIGRTPTLIQAQSLLVKNLCGGNELEMLKKWKLFLDRSTVNDIVQKGSESLTNVLIHAQELLDDDSINIYHWKSLGNPDYSARLLMRHAFHRLNEQQVEKYGEYFLLEMLEEVSDKMPKHLLLEARFKYSSIVNKNHLGLIVKVFGERFAEVMFEEYTPYSLEDLAPDIHYRKYRDMLKEHLPRLWSELRDKYETKRI